MLLIESLRRLPSGVLQRLARPATS
jgi:hypothetical protein